MKRKEILINFNLDNKEFRMLIKLKKIIKVSYNNFDVLDKQYVLDGNYEIFKQDYHQTSEYIQKIAKRNAKVNKSRWLKQSDEDRKKFGNKISNSLVQTYTNNPEIIEKMKTSLKQYWSNVENRKQQSEKMIELYKDQSKRSLISKYCKQYWSDENIRIAKSEQMKQLYKEHPEIIEKMKETNRQTQSKIWTEEKCKQQSEILKNVWEAKKSEIMKKIHNSMKENNTFNSSKPANKSIELLKNTGLTIKEEYLYPNKQWKCDAYIVELDTYIEFHYGMFHGPKEFHEPFDKNNNEHLKIKHWLEENFKDKPKNRLHYQLYNWTNLDVRKKEYAENTNLNWFAFYNESEFKQWLEILMN